MGDHGFHPLTVKAVVEETSEARSFVLDVPEELRPSYRYRAGQFCTFRVRLDGEPLLRCYSMSSSPDTDADLTTTVKRVPGGRISNWMNDVVAVGDVLETTVPAGVFCLRESGADIVAFSGGSGITPVLSIIKTALATTARRVRLLYANRDVDSIIFAAALADLWRRYGDRLSVAHHLDVDAGFVDAGVVRSFVASGTDADFYICGPPPFMDLVEGTLGTEGVAGDRIFIERFAAVPAPAAASEDLGDGPASVTIVLDGRPTVVPYHPGDTLLGTARRGGLSPPFSCESGNCATCMAHLQEGEATMRANNALTAEEVADGWVLTCQGVPTSPTVTVVYED